MGLSTSILYRFGVSPITRHGCSWRPAHEFVQTTAGTFGIGGFRLKLAGILLYRLPQSIAAFQLRFSCFIDRRIVAD